MKAAAAKQQQASSVVPTSFTVEALNEFKCDLLRLICREFGLTKFKREGVEKPVSLSYARKGEMVESLTEYAVTAPDPTVTVTEPDDSETPEVKDYQEAPNLTHFLKQWLIPQFDKTILSSIRRGLSPEVVCKGCCTLMFDLYNTVSNWRGRSGRISGETVKSYIGQLFRGLCDHVQLVITDTSIRETVLSDLAFYKSTYIRETVRHNLQRQQERLVERRTSVSEVKVEPIYNWAFDVIDKADVVLTTEGKGHWVDLSLALMLVTGRRSAEIGSTGVFTKTNNPNELMFSGQLKTKYEEGSQREYPIPVLYNVDKVLHALSVLEQAGRKLSPTLHPDRTRESLIKQVHSSFRSSYVGLAKKMSKRFFPECPHTVTCQHYRQLYSQVCSAVFRPAHMKPQAYISSILGHLWNDVYSGQHYDVDYTVLDAEFIVEGKWAVA